MEFEVCHCGFSLMYVEILVSNVTDKWIWWLGHSARTYLRLPWKPLIEVDGSTLYVINAESKVSSYTGTQIGSIEATKASIVDVLALICCTSVAITEWGRMFNAFSSSHACIDKGGVLYKTILHLQDISLL